MELVCAKCGEVFVKSLYRSGFLLENENNKVEGCMHSYIEVDENIAPAISLFIRKGWQTKFSCAGHVHDGMCCSYIYFKEPIFSVVNTSYPVDSCKSIVRGAPIREIEYRSEEKTFTDQFGDEEPLAQMTTTDYLTMMEINFNFCKDMLKLAMEVPYRKDITLPSEDSSNMDNCIIDEFSTMNTEWCDKTLKDFNEYCNKMEEDENNDGE